MGKRPSPARALLVGLVASLAAGLADAALGTSKPPDVVYRTPSPAPTTAVDTTIRDTAQQAVGTLQGVLDVLQTVRCVNGVCTFPNGTVTTPPLPTRPPSPTTAVILPGVRPTQPTARPTASRQPTPAPTAKPPTAAPVVTPAPTAAAPPTSPPASSGSSGGASGGSQDGGSTADKQLTPGPTQAPVDPRLPRGGPGGPVAAVAAKGEKKPFNYMPLVWGAVALWGAIILAIGIALFMQRGRAKPQQPLAASMQQATPVDV